MDLDARHNIGGRQQVIAVEDESPFAGNIRFCAPTPLRASCLEQQRVCHLIQVLNRLQRVAQPLPLPP